MSPFFLFFVTACVVVALGVIGVCYDVIHVRSTDLAIRLKSMFVCEELSTFGCGFFVKNFNFAKLCIAVHQ